MGIYQIELDTMEKVNRFVKLANECKTPVYILNNDKYVGNGKSMLNVLASLEWGSLNVQTEDYLLFKEFFVE